MYLLVADSVLLSMHWIRSLDITDEPDSCYSFSMASNPVNSTRNESNDKGASTSSHVGGHRSNDGGGHQLIDVGGSFSDIAATLLNLNFAIKLDNLNYLIWRKQFLSIIIAFGMDDVIDKTILHPIQFLEESSRVNNAYAPWNLSQQSGQQLVLCQCLSPCKFICLEI